MSLTLSRLEPLPRGGVRLNEAEAARYVAALGLSRPEEHGRWTDGGRVRLAFRLAERPAGGITLMLEALGYVAPGFVAEQRAALTVNGMPLGDLVVRDTVLQPRLIVVPPEAIGADGAVVLEMLISTCVQPALLGINEDRRFLGLLLARISWQKRAGVLDPARFEAERGRPVGRESRKSFDAKIESGFWARYVTGPDVLDVGFQGYAQKGQVVPILPGAIGVDLDFPGYDGRRLPFADNSQDAVYSSHCLEHVADCLTVIQDWFRATRIGGHIITVVPSAHLYERRRRIPSRWNADHKRVYTPSSLLAEFEAALVPNSYRVRHLAENDAGYRYDLPPSVHPEGCHEVELVIEKIARPDWKMED
jgi:SAM-dependent methyltransferase